MKMTLGTRASGVHRACFSWPLVARILAVLSEPAVREVYQRADRECAIINSRTFPSARSIQELVMAWKRLRK
jgi:hypothetical protein